ncbi:hypothetical protein HPP92_025748 [Vanilla planifolia]|uniref:Late embryogenesis abundant protein LEA-2 subgroup domain-containing protein n=1 Tax=Vanilla planifolia TaxID=51239 RepID=A0A835PJL8_VANPL|nr:hypothetical protein HPP92_025748 [Vanilla planifolia]
MQRKLPTSSSPTSIQASGRRITPFRCFAITVLSLIVVAGLIVLIFYLVVRPVPFTYSVDDARIHDYNISSSDELNATFDLALVSDNPNRHVSVYYDSIAVAVWYDGQMLAFAEPPSFHQPKMNATRLVLLAAARGLPLLGAVAEGIKRDRSAGEVGLEVRVRAWVRFKVGVAKTRHYKLRAYCSPVVVRFPAPAVFQRTYCDVDV